MVKLTKKQCKQRDRIEAWLKDEPFPENARDKNPKVPEFSITELLDPQVGYVPQYVSDGAKFYTPLEMGSFVWDHLMQLIPLPERILEPCAGIGNLVYHAYEWTKHGLEMRGIEPYEDTTFPIIDALEADEEAVKVGVKTFPEANWYHVSAYDHYERLQGKYDLVFMNPPFNITWATYGGELMAEGKCKKSEHYFLELAIRACKPGGTIAVIAPYNYLDRLPKTFRPWVEQYTDGWDNLGKLPGEFAFTKVQVHGWIINRNDEPLAVTEGFGEMNDFLITDKEKSEILLGALEKVVEQSAKNNEALKELVAQVEGKGNGSAPENVIILPQEVFDEIASAHTDGSAPWDSPKELIKHLRKLGKHEASKWVRENQIEYGIGYWNEFRSETNDVLELTA